MKTIALLIFVLVALAACSGTTAEDGQSGDVPVSGRVIVNGTEYVFSGAAAMVTSTVPPTDTPTVPPTDTPTVPPTDTPTVPPTDTPTVPPTDTPTVPPTDTPDTPTGDIDVGTHGWGYILDTMVSYPQKNATLSILIPSLMRQENYDWPDMVAAAGFAGPAESKIDGLARQAGAAAGSAANVLIYVPEGQTTSANVPYSETVYLEEYVDRLVSLGAKYPQFTLNYGPSLELVSLPGSWQYGKNYELDAERVSGLAAKLPDGSFWSLRMHTPELMYRNYLPGFAAAVEEYVTAIHQGNPSIRIMLHLSCAPGTEDKFMSYLDVSRDYIDQVYAGIDYPFPSEPDSPYDPIGTIATVTEILTRTGAVLAPPPTVTPPTATPPTATPTPTPTPTMAPTAMAFYNLVYGPDPAHVLDIYIPAGRSPFPAIAWFHGGGLTSGDKSQQRTKCQEMAAEGFACVAPNYRLVPDGFYLPDQVHDAKAVIRWMRANASKYGLDPERIGAIGGSSGAFLSTILGTSSGEAEVEGAIGPNLGYSSRVQASFGIAGIYSFRSYFRSQVNYCVTKDPYAIIPACFQDGDEQGKGGFFFCYLNQQECMERLDSSSALYWVSAGDPPSAVLVGTLDPTPYALEDHTLYHEALLAAGVDSTLFVMPGYGHVDLWPDDKPFIVGFFKEHLGAQ